MSTERTFARRAAAVRLCYKICLEPITHFLTGAVLARAGFNRKTALATATMTLAAESPDLDVFWGFKGPVYGFAHHRGFTHSFLGLILTSAVVTVFMYLVWRLRRRETNTLGQVPRWRLLFLSAYIAGLSHILLDYTNNYGVRPFWPFWEKWYSWDIVFIVEPALYIILLGALILPVIFSRRQPLPHGCTAARIGLACVLALYLARDFEHHKAVETFRRQRFEGAPPLRVSAFPYDWNVFRWYGVAETPTSFEGAEIDSRTGAVNSSELGTVPKPPETPASLAAKRSYLGRVYLDWAQYPLVTEAESGDDTVVQFRDFRFDYGRLRGKGPLSCTVTLDRDLNIIGEALGARQQSPPLD